MKSISLIQIASWVDSQCEINCEIDNIVIDSRKVNNRCLFVAIKGENFDGHDYIETAFKNGAIACISHKKTSNPKVIVVRDTRKAFLDIAKNYRLLFDIPIVGVTGSVGKTTTKQMIYSVLSNKWKTLKTEGNFNNEIGLPQTLFGLDDSFDWAVIEMGMSNLEEISRLSITTNPQIGVISNVGVSHIENLGSRENILKAKLEILDGMDKKKSLLVLNADDDMLYSVKGKIENPVFYYGIQNKNADYVGKNIIQKDFSTEFDVEYQDKITHIVIPAIGLHNVLNALSAFCVGKIAGMSDDEIKAGLENYKNTGMRQQISVVQNITVIKDCYNASPDSMQASINVLDSINNNGKKVGVFGDMLELGELEQQLHKNVGDMVLNSKINLLICYGDLAYNIYNQAKNQGFENAYHFLDKKEVINFLKNNLNSNDAIIYKASRGMKLEEIINNVHKESN